MERKEKIEGRLKRKKRIRKKISGTAARPRLCVFKSLKHMYAQLVDDGTGKVITGVSTLTAEVKGGIKYGGNAAKRQEGGRGDGEEGAGPRREGDSFRSERLQVSRQGQGTCGRRPGGRTNLLEEVSA